MNPAGSVPPLGNSSAPTRSETWTDNLGRMGEERLAHVKELIEAELGQRTPHFGQSNISVRHFDDHLVITWEANGDYGRAWTAWSDSDVQAAYSALLEKKQQAFAADEKYRNAQAKEYGTKKSLFPSAKSREVVQEEGKSAKAWIEYYKAQQAFGAEYETKFNAAPPGQKRLTFEIWLVFNINGALPQNLPSPVASEFGDLTKQPVNHFLRVQRSNYPSGPTAASPSTVPPPYPSRIL